MIQMRAGLGNEIAKITTESNCSNIKCAETSATNQRFAISKVLFTYWNFLFMSGLKLLLWESIFLMSYFLL